MTYEDVLESIVGPHSQHNIEINKSDIGIMTSIARQTRNNVGLTDRQFALVKEKLNLYKDQIPDYVQPTMLRIPLREIDRRHYVCLEKVNDDDYIVIRFPFKKKLIDLVDEIRRLNPDKHVKDKQKHFFLLSEKAVYEIVKLAKRFPAFEIEDILLEWYNQLEDVNNNKYNYIPYVKNNNVFNVSDNCREALIKHCGQEDTLLFYDRRNLFGIDEFDLTEVQNNLSNISVLTQKIITRKSHDLYISSKEWNINHLAFSINELNRYPLLVALNEQNALDELSLVHKAFNGFINNSECSVVFRLDNDGNSGTHFNDYVRDNNLNNSVAFDTKIVYTNSKIPKPLLNLEFRPSCVLTLGTKSMNNKIDLFAQGVDLNIAFSAEESMIGKYYGRREKI